MKRLPKAIEAILSNYRGARVSSVLEKAIPDVLRRLAEAAERQKCTKCSRKRWSRGRVHNISKRKLNT